MNPISTTIGLKNAIRQLEIQQQEELSSLKQEFKRTQENLKPLNLLKNTFKSVVNVPDIKTDMINAAIGLTTGILTKKMVLGKTHNPLTKMLGIALEMFVTNKVSQNADQIRSTGGSILQKLFGRKNRTEKVL